MHVMNTTRIQLHEILDHSRPARRDRHLDQLIASRRATESAIGLAMVTSCLPGIEVQFLEQEVIELPPGDLTGSCCTRTPP